MPETFLGRTYSPDSKTWVEPKGARRITPMKVLALGLPRTGTASMTVALEMLGYDRVYHMASCIQNPPDCAMWKKACKAKFYGEGRMFGKEEWDQLLGQYQAVTDFPPAAFAADLISAYPDAKVVLNNRDADAWYESVKSTIIATLNSRKPSILKLIDPKCLGAWVSMCEVMWWGFFSRNGSCGSNKNEDDIYAASSSSSSEEEQEDWHKVRFRAHYDEVRKLVPNEKLLEYHPSEGWEPLCKFLDKEAPNKPFPRVNESGEFSKMMDEMVRDALKRYCINLLSFILPVLLLFIYKYVSK